MEDEPVRVDRLWPDPAAAILLDDAFAELRLPPAPADRPLVAVNMVTSVDGRAQIDGGAEGLSGRADRRLMRLLRAAFDAVATGSGTLRAAGFWPDLPAELADRRAAAGRARQPLSVVAAASHPAPLERWHARESRRLLVVGSDNPQEAEPGTELLRAPTPDPDPRWLLDELRLRGVASLLLEGGPTTNAAFLAAGCLDELFWTIGPLLVAASGLPMIAPLADPASGADLPRQGGLVSLHRHGDELFARYRFG
jgi:riboflavin biosynthesis pyrimidine reductase